MVMQDWMPAVWICRMAFSRAGLEGHPGSKVFRTSSSSVVTVMLTWTRPPLCSISWKSGMSRVTSGLRVCTTSLGLWWLASFPRISWVSRIFC